MTANSEYHGGPAFPRPNSAYTSQEAQEGMTLLDWFAGQIVAGSQTTQDTRLRHVAESAYDLAAAMVWERTRRLKQRND